MEIQKKISELKELYEEIYTVKVERIDFIFRPLTLAQYETIASHSEWDSADSEDAIVESALLWPENVIIGKLKAGTISALAEEIMEVSAFLNPQKAKEIFDSKRHKSLEVLNIMKAILLTVKNEIGLEKEEINNMTFGMLAANVSLAEQIIKIKKSIYDPNTEIQLEILIPEEIKEIDKLAQQEEYERALRQGRNPDKSSTFGAATIDDPIAQKLRAAMGG